MRVEVAPYWNVNYRVLREAAESKEGRSSSILECKSIFQFVVF